jgi:hypothetical protein
MDNLKIVGQIASGFGIVFIVFAAFQAFVAYQQVAYQSPPASILQAYILSAMLPFLLFAVLSFVVGAVTIRQGKGVSEKQASPELQTEKRPVETATT